MIAMTFSSTVSIKNKPSLLINLNDFFSVGGIKKLEMR